jgi:hypothetical protein
MAGVLDQLQQWMAQNAGQPLQQRQQQQRQMPAEASSTQLELQVSEPSMPGAAGLLRTVALSLASSTNTAEAYAHLLCTLKQEVCARYQMPGHTAAAFRMLEQDTHTA